MLLWQDQALCIIIVLIHIINAVNVIKTHIFLEEIQKIGLFVKNVLKKKKIKVYIIDR